MISKIDPCINVEISKKLQDSREKLIQRVPLLITLFLGALTLFFVQTELKLLEQSYLHWSQTVMLCRVQEDLTLCISVS